jgi:hypothetical protein
MATTQETVLSQYLQILALKRQGASGGSSSQIQEPENIVVPPNPAPAERVNEKRPPLVQAEECSGFCGEPECRPQGNPGRSRLAVRLAAELRKMMPITEENIEDVAKALDTVVFDYLERVDQLLSNGKPVRTTQRSAAFWWHRCPEGHFTDHYMWSHQCVAIVCPECLSIYDPDLCRLMPRLIPQPNAEGGAR